MSAEEQSTSRIGLLEEAWRGRGSQDLGQWAAQVSSAFFDAKISTETASKFLDTQLAEFEATLALATLDDSDLKLISEANPPVTTWLFLAECSSENLPSLLKAMANEVDEKSFGQRVQAFIEKIRGPSISDELASLDSKVFMHLAKKAEQFGALPAKSIGALKSFGSRLRAGKPLTFKQVNYAHDLLVKLYEQGVVSKDSKDGDEEIMTPVLKLLGKE